MLLRPVLLSAALVFGSAAAHALPLTYAVTVSEGLTNGSGFDSATFTGFTGTNTANATFTYTSPTAAGLNFSDTQANNTTPAGDLNSTFGFSASNVSGYTGSGTITSNGMPSGTHIADFTSIGTFLSSSGSASPYQYGSLYTFDLGTLAAGTILTITHDDGISLFDNGVRFGTTVSGPTSQVTDTAVVGATGDIVLHYARENGTPSILQVSATAATPEPSSLALLGTGLLGLAGMVRRRLA